MEFHETRMGKRFYEYDFPQMVRELKRIADAMEVANSTK